VIALLEGCERNQSYAHITFYSTSFACTEGKYTPYTVQSNISQHTEVHIHFSFIISYIEKRVKRTLRSKSYVLYFKHCGKQVEGSRKSLRTFICNFSNHATN
jgi:hypothetical protein